MTSALIAPLIPPPARPGGGGRGRPDAVRGLPLAALPGYAAALAGDVVYGMGRIDAAGRGADRPGTGARGWRGSDRLTLTADAGVVTARRDPHGLVSLPPRHCIMIPATLRHRCGLLTRSWWPPGRPGTR